MRVVVTGAGGFVASHLATILREAGHHVVPVTFSDVDLTRAWPTDLLHERGGYDAIIHLAGLAAVGPSFTQPQRYIEAHSSMVTNMGEALVSQGFDGRVIIVSTGAVYGAATGVLDEAVPVQYPSPYVVSKILTEVQAEYYRARGLDFISARPFNHIGPGQGPGFIVPDLTAKLRELAPGGVLLTGNLDSARDYTDVRDVARAYVALLEAPHLERSVYNIASGSALSGHEVLDAICAVLGVEVPSTRTEQTRAIDPSVITGSAARLHEETGWVPRIPFEQSVRDFVTTSGATTSED